MIIILKNKIGGYRDKYLICKKIKPTTLLNTEELTEITHYHFTKHTTISQEKVINRW